MLHIYTNTRTEGKVGQKSIEIGYSPVPASILLLVRKATRESKPTESRGKQASPPNLYNVWVTLMGVFTGYTSLKKNVITFLLGKWR